MADAAYDAVVVGGGTKAMCTAIYLAKYGGMSVGVFEERRELCGGMTTEQACVPGFAADYHATGTSLWYYAPIRQDFPDFEEKGGKVILADASIGSIVLEDQTCMVIYSVNADPTQERTAKELARFSSERDAETYLKLWELTKPGTDYDLAFLQETFNVFLRWDDPTPSPIQRWVTNYLAQPDCLIDPGYLSQPGYLAIPRLWERPALANTFMRFIMIRGVPINIGGALDALFIIGTLPTSGCIQGGTHNVAHAYQRILYENGGRWFCRKEVDKIIIVNGVARGIRLTDGTQVEAKKLVLSGVNPLMLCSRLIGPDYISPRILKAIEDTALRARMVIAMGGGLHWDTYFVHELPKYKAAEFNPSINRCRAVYLATDDPDCIYHHSVLTQARQQPPLRGSLVCGSNTVVDNTRAPEGKHTVYHDRTVVGPPQGMSERETERWWLEFKKNAPQEILNEWQLYAPNMTWDNVIGIFSDTPWDASQRNLNFRPTMGAGRLVTGPGMERSAPVPELLQHRTPIKNLFATGGYMGRGGASGNQGYTCYKVISQDHGLRKPWEEKGRPY